MNNEHNRSTTCCFTGYRPQKLPWGTNESDVRCRELKKRIYNAVAALYDAGIRHFICGMALGCDMIFCEAVIRLREMYWDVTLEAAVPGSRQSERWDEKGQARYEELVSLCDDCTMIDEGDYTESLLARNRYMVDHSCVLLSVYDGRPGGTQYTISYARKAGIEIIEIPPLTESFFDCRR